MKHFSAISVASDDQAFVSWDRLTAVAKTSGGKANKTLLSDISGYVAPESMLAIMGPSGCGKTTLLDTLAGRVQGNVNVSGSIRVNGKQVKMSYGTVAYVPQEDLLTGTLTVRETLLFTARLRLNVPAAERLDLVESLMEELGLSQAADTPVGTIFIKGISGGQKRRLSIAQEVLVSPSVMFLDEPTSGLDAAAAFFCVSALRTLASQGRSIIMSIHQPSSEVFALFDYLLLLSRGEMIFFGEASEAEGFYAEAGLACPQCRSLAEHFIHCINTDFDKEFADFEPASTIGSAAIAKAQHLVSHLKSIPGSMDDTAYDNSNLQHRQHTRHMFSKDISLHESSRPAAESSKNVHTSRMDTFASEVTINFQPPPEDRVDSMGAITEELTHMPGESDFAPVLVAMERETDPLNIPNAERDISALRTKFEASLRDNLQKRIETMVSTGAPLFQGIKNNVNPISHFITLVHRQLLNAHRDVGVFWLRYVMYLIISLCLGTVYYGLDRTWTDATSRGGCMTFLTFFFTIMVISGFPSFIDEMRVFLRERLNGYYGVLPYTFANTVASIPYLIVISVSCTLVVYYLAGLNSEPERVLFFMLLVFGTLCAAEALLMTLSALVTNSLVGIAAFACYIGMLLPVAGYVVPIDEIPRPVWYYPFHWMGFLAYSFHGLYLNEFKGTGAVWHCPCELANACDDTNGPCRINGDQVLDALDYSKTRSKWLDLIVLFVITLINRLAFFGTLKLKEFMAK